MHPRGLYRIQTIARLTGFSPAVLRVWETRHHLLCPQRSPGGQRLYTDDDLQLLRRVKGLIDQARASFDALDYENTVKALDSAIGALEAQPTAEARRLLPQAYDMRARSLFSLGKEPEARRDFTSLLKTEPGYVLTGQHVGRRELVGAAVIVVGLAAFALFGDPAGGRENAPGSEWAVAIAVLGAICVVLLIISFAAPALSMRDFVRQEIWTTLR